MQVKIRNTGEPFTDQETGRTWGHLETDTVDADTALRLLENEGFVDARHWTQRKNPIVGSKKEQPVEQPKVIIEGKRIEGIKREIIEEPMEAPLVNLGSMTKESISMYVHRNFGVELPDNMTKEKMIDKARDFMGGAPRHF